jgi:hypothetical protein
MKRAGVMRCDPVVRTALEIVWRFFTRHIRRTALESIAPPRVRLI